MTTTFPTRSSLSTLPPEIIGEIISHLEQTVPSFRILRLASTCRVFTDACARIAYKNICLHNDLEKVKRCCETLAFNSVSASYVRKFSIVFAPRSGPPKSAFTAQFNRLLRSALQNVSNGLRELSLRIPNGNVPSCLKRLSFPNLKTLQVETPLNPDMAMFLLGHTKLEELRILGPLTLPLKGRGNKGAHRSMSILMPSLKKFAGPAGSCPIFLPGSQTHSVDLSWGAPLGQGWEHDFTKAMSESAQPITSVGFIDFRYRDGLFDALVENLSSITKLTLGMSDPDQIMTVMDGVMRILPDLPHLYYFALAPPSQRRIDLSRLDEDLLNLDHILLEEVSERRGTLSICQLLTGVKWGRLEVSGQWLPLFPTPVGLAWWFQRTPLVMHLQRRVIGHLARRIGTVNADSFDDELSPSRPEVQKLANAVGFLVNRAFGLDELDDDSEYEYDPDTEEEYEPLRVPTRDCDGNTMTPYEGAEAKEDWDMFVSTLGFMSLHPLNLILQNMALFDLFMPPVQTPIPVLNDGQKELMKIIMDVMFNSFVGARKRGIRFKNYFRNPDEVWGEEFLSLGVPFEDKIIPLTTLVG